MIFEFEVNPTEKNFGFFCNYEQLEVVHLYQKLLFVMHKRLTILLEKKLTWSQVYSPVTTVQVLTNHPAGDHVNIEK